MCQFRVMRESREGGQAIASVVIRARSDSGVVSLVDTRGQIRHIDGAFIARVDTLMAELVLGQSPTNGERQPRSLTDAQRPVIPEELRGLERFHGHLGPYVVLGMRMGMITRAKFPQRI